MKVYSVESIDENGISKVRWVRTPEEALKDIKEGETAFEWEVKRYADAIFDADEDPKEIATKYYHGLYATIGNDIFYLGDAADVIS